MKRLITACARTVSIPRLGQSMLDRPSHGCWDSTMKRLALLCCVVLITATPYAQDDTRLDWPVYAGDEAATHYSPLAEIDRATVRNLIIAWRWRPNEKVLKEFGTQPGTFQNTPL